MWARMASGDVMLVNYARQIAWVELVKPMANLIVQARQGAGLCQSRVQAVLVTSPAWVPRGLRARHLEQAGVLAVPFMSATYAVLSCPSLTDIGFTASAAADH